MLLGLLVIVTLAWLGGFALGAWWAARSIKQRMARMLIRLAKKEQQGEGWLAALEAVGYGLKDL